MRVTGVVVVYDVSCPNCSRIARELPDLVRVPVTVRSCRDPQLADTYPGLTPRVRSCGTPAVGIVRGSGQVRWWTGLTGAIGLLPLLRWRELPEAAELLGTALRTRRRGRAWG
ncbi:hypothetical protein ACQEVB_20390 [Pseudonocardia sp. CA-107938]|uniref:hypothetical protein n=1 Tax=Pseudonocardia sp. CA-107938 TaxID=3240021 RepID=UPI003D94328C